MVELEVAERAMFRVGSGQQSWEERNQVSPSRLNIDARFLAHCAGALCFAGALSGCAEGAALDDTDRADGRGVVVEGAEGEGPRGTVGAALIVDGGAEGDAEWQRSLGSLEASVSSGGVSAGADGIVFITGTTDGDVGGAQQGVTDAFLAAYSAAGEALWVRQLGSAEADASSGVSAASDGAVFIAGSTSGALDGAALGFGDAFVSKYSSAGDLVWTRQLGTSQPDAASSVSTAANGDVLVAGSTRGVLDGARSGSDNDALVARYSAAGELLWARQLGSAPGYDDIAAGVSVDGSGNVYIAGHTLGDLDGDSLGAADAFVAKYSAGGELLWVHQRGSAGHDAAETVSVDESGNVFVAGQIGGTRVRGPGFIIPGTPFAAKLAPTGEVLWETQLEDAAGGSVSSSSTDLDGNLFVAGHTAGAVEGDNQGLYDTFVVKLSSEGERLGALQLGVAEKDQATGVSADGSGGVFLSHDVTSAEAEGFDRSLLTRRSLGSASL